jgi:serine protease DegQ
LLLGAAAGASLSLALTRSRGGRPVSLRRKVAHQLLCWHHPFPDAVRRRAAVGFYACRGPDLAIDRQSERPPALVTNIQPNPMIGIKRRWSWVLVAAAIGLSGCGGGSNKQAATTPTATSPAEASLLAGGIPQIVNRVEPQVVTVLTPGGVGSGVVYRSNGIILTNEHVVRGHSSVQIAFADGRREPGRVIAADPDTDLALVRVDRDGLPAATLQQTLPRVGALAVVLGSPLGFEKSVTAGIVSGLHRSIPGSARESAALIDLMQTDAPISPGNSGGAVVDGQGRVIGISESYIPPEQGAVAIGFAIPAATAVNIADQLLKTGRVQHAFIGIQPAELTPQLAQELGIGQTSGVLVYGVTAGGPAAQAHVSPGDILVAIAGKPLTTAEDLFTALRQKRPGETVRLELVREGKRKSVDVRLSDKPQ